MGFFRKMFNLGGDDESSPKKPTAKKEALFASVEPSVPDIEFAENFTQSGGKFLFCEDVDTAIKNLQNIGAETGLSKVYSPDANLKSLMARAGFRDFAEKCTDAELFCTTCEYLVAYNGGIMVDARHTKGNKLKDLPDVFVILAFTDQLVSRLNDALKGIQQRYSGKEMPSEITTLHGPNKSGLQDPGSVTATKEIYLLYVER